MEKFEVNMDNLTDDEKKQLLSLIEIANTRIDDGIPMEGDEFFFVNASGAAAESRVWTGTNWQHSLLRFGNFFKTKEEAEFCIGRQLLLTELEAYAKRHNDDAGLYILKYGLGEIVAVIGPGYGLGTVKFSSPDIAMEAVKKIGKERIVKYYFGIGAPHT